MRVYLQYFFLYNWVKISLQSEQYEEIYKGLKFERFTNSPKFNLLDLTLPIITKTSQFISVELLFSSIG